MEHLPPQDLWAVTAYFNPAGYTARLLNYRLFRQHLKLPLLTVALQYGEPELGPSDADLLVTLTEGDVLWQKERLFNIARQHLPDSCTKIVWVDCDVVFPQADWTLKVRQALDLYPVVQPFSHVAHCHREHLESTLQKQAYISDSPHEFGVAYLSNRGACVGNTRDFQEKVTKPHSSPGIAWATRRELSDKLEFYDPMIIGSGDVAFWAGVSGKHQLFYATERPPKVVDSWLDWQSRAKEQTEGRVGHVDSWVLNLHHGSHIRRDYAHRWELPCREDFDPLRDIRINSQGTWTWNSHKPQLHQGLIDYFSARREDDR